MEGTDLKEHVQISAEVAAAVSAARRLITALLHADEVPAADMAEVAEQLTAVADRLESGAPGPADRIAALREIRGIAEYRQHAGRRDLVTGPQNAIAPPLKMRGLPDGSVAGTATLGLQYQGPPGCVHGGILALLLDHILGTANWRAGTTGPTGELTLRYERPTPLLTELTVWARQVSVDGRKIRTEGTISANGQVCVRAEGLFIAPRGSFP
jgi:acyl-coenzyme A thioesterase PaaI-like protein